MKHDQIFTLRLELYQLKILFYIVRFQCDSKPGDDLPVVPAPPPNLYTEPSKSIIDIIDKKKNEIVNEITVLINKAECSERLRVLVKEHPIYKSIKGSL